MSKCNKYKQNDELCLRFQTLPTFAQQLISYIHYKTGAAAELIFTVLLGGMAYACQDLFDVQLKHGRSFTSLYLLLLAKSGSRKSTIFRMLMEAIYQLEKELKDDYQVKKDLYELNFVPWNTKFKKLNKLYGKADATEESEALKALGEHQRKRPAEPVRQRLILNDTTYEGLKKVIAQGSPSLMLGSDEAGGLFSRNLFCDTAGFNSLWGEGRLAESRASRDSYDVDDVRLTILLLLQSKLFDKYLRGKQGENAQDSGWLARLLMVDLEQLPEFCDVPDDRSWSNETVLEEFFSIITKYLQDGMKRRENNEERICITFSQEAQAVWNRQSKSVQDQINDKGTPQQQHDELSNRFMEHASRIAAVMQMFITPDSPIISQETFISALEITQWFTNHSICKIDSTRKPSDAEVLLSWLEEHVISNETYDFRRHGIRRDGPNSLRDIDRLKRVLNELESDGEVQLFNEGGVDYVKFIGSKLEPRDLAKALGIPLHLAGYLEFNKLRRPE